MTATPSALEAESNPRRDPLLSDTHPAQSQRLLGSTIEARIADVAPDDTPHVASTWFGSTGEEAGHLPGPLDGAQEVVS